MAIQLRDYQERIVNKTIDSFNNNINSVLIVSPTGSGKSCIALSILKLLQQQNPSLTVGWVAMRRKLLQQAELENEKVGANNIEYISMFEQNPSKRDIVVVDEGHHGAANICLALQRKINPKWFLSLTGTPFRTDRMKLAYEKVITDAGVRYLIEQGWLSPFEQYFIPEFTVDSVVKHFLASPEKWGKSIIYMKNKQDCDEVNRKLQEAGIASDVLYSDTTLPIREDIYSKFENGKLQVLVNIYLLVEGFDAPDLQTVWIRDTVKLCIVQMAGRSLRKDPKNPNKVAKIIQPQDAIYPYFNTAKPVAQYVEVNGQWRSISENEMVASVSRIAQDMKLSRPLSIIPDCSGVIRRNGDTLYLYRKENQ